MFDVLAIGELNCDYIFTGLGSLPVAGRELIADSFTQTLGSSTAICASGLAKLGLSTAFCTLTGDDGGGHFALEALKKNNIDTCFCKIDPGIQTGVTISMTYSSDRAMVTYLGAIESFSLKDFNIEIVKQARHIHVGSFYLQHGLRKDLPELFSYARKNNVTTSLDAGWDDSGRWDGGIHELMTYTDIFFPNEGEAMNITKASSVEEAASRLGAAYSVVKCGEKGAVCWHNGKLYTGKPFPVEPVDTTGAGDSFNAGFLYGFLNGFPVEKALTYGTACGAVSVTRIGGASNCATLEDVEKLMGAGM